MLKPPVAHKVLGLGREAVGKRRRSPVVGIRPGRPIPSLPGLPGLASPQASQPSPLSGGTRVDNKRRFSTQGALATDLAYVQEQLAKVAEAPTDEKQEKQEVDHWWCAIFLPLPAPRQLLPLVLADQQGLVGDPDKKEREKFQAQVKLAPDELEEVVRLCHTFVQMVQPPQITLEHQEEISENVLLSRPSFCQLLVAMGLTSMEKCLVPRYHYALKCFDAEASSCEVPGIAPFGRLVMAVRLPALPAKDEALEGLVNDRLTPRITRLFGRLLEDLALLPFWEGQDMAEALPRAKKYFFFKMLPAAQAYGEERIQVLQKQAIQLKHENIRISSSNSSQLPEAEATEPATSVAGDLDTTKGAPSLRGLSAGSATSRSSISHFTRMTHDLDAISEVSEALSSPKKLPRASRTGASLGSRQTTRTKRDGRDATVKILEVQPPTPLEDATVMEPVPLPPEMVKAEFMQNQLLEPEVLSFVATFSSIFQVLFRAYSDFPARDMGGGHMSISAFLRFCYDFGLFSVIDLQSLQRLYSLCSETLELSAPKDAKPKKRRGNKKPEQVFFWNGLQVPQRFEWLTKEFAHHDAQEAACAGVLGAMHDWMKDRTWTPNDLFTLLDWNGNGGICAEELVEGVRLMRLDHLPPCEELQRLASLLLSPETGSITPYELQQALAIIAKQKHKLVLAANFFLKADQDMSEVERNASVFFKDLIKVMEKNGWTPTRLFHELGGASGETITKEKLEDKAKVLMRLHCGRTSGLEVTQPFDILDLNGDGVIEEEEFLAIVGQVLKALRTQQREGKQRRQLQAAVTAVAKSWSVATARELAASKHGFGLAHFMECLLLISCEVVGIRGTPMQAQQPTITKVVWLILYLRWQYELKLQQDIESAQQEVVWVAKLGLSDGKSCCQYSTPLQRLFQDYPNLFKDVLSSKQAMNSTFQPSSMGCCEECGRAPHRGWGSVVCPKCSDADVALKACWRSHKACAGQRVSLIKSMLEPLLQANGDPAEHREMLS